jgi:hypothetical protein
VERLEKTANLAVNRHADHPASSSKWSVRAGMTCSRRFAGGRPSSRLALGIVRFYFRSCRKDVTYGTILRIKHVAHLIAFCRFPPPWSVDELKACFVVKDGAGQKLAYVCRDRTLIRRMD